jgi:predicted ATPase
VEAIAHLTKGLDLLKTLPDTPERAQQELTLQLALGAPLVATKSYAAPEAERVYIRARELCRQLGETPQLFWALISLLGVDLVRAEVQTARELAERLLSLARSVHSPTYLMWAHNVLGMTLYCLGDFALAQDHLEQALALYDPQKHAPLVSGDVQDSRVSCLCYAAPARWALGYPDQALKRSQEALTLAQELSHPYSLAWALGYGADLHWFCGKGQMVRQQAEALRALSSEQGFAHYLAQGTIWRGWALAEQGQGEEGVAQIRQGLAAYQATGSELARPRFLALLAEAYGKVGQAAEGLHALAEALTLVNKTGERYYEAELYRLKGELTLQKFQVPSRVGSAHQKVRIAEAGTVGGAHPTGEEEAEEYFLRAIEIARRQSAKSLELRAVISLSRLWQSQGKQQEAHKMLAEIYGWFTEGFDTRDLQEAKALLEELNH